MLASKALFRFNSCMKPICAAIACLILLHAGLCLATDEARAASPPNILFAIADDWGVHAGVYGTKWIETPAFDRVAREGILFQHTGSPACPSHLLASSTV